MFVVNPGTEPVNQATVENALANMVVFGKDLKPLGVEVLRIERAKDLDYGEGRFAFKLFLSKDGKEWNLEIQMPGLPIERVRYLGPPQDIWQFPRLYVDGSSWVWKFAINVSVPGREETA